MIKDLLTLIGVATVINIIIGAIKELIRKLKIRYKQKHRFDKTPIANCYCVDCKFHNNETGECYKLDRRHTADCWFCWYATPRDEETDNNDDKRDY